MTNASPIVKLRRLSMRALRDRRGGTAIEYGLILALVVLALLAALQGMASTTVGIWNNVASKVATATGY